MTEQAFEIFKVNSNELEQLRAVSIQTFTETFAGQNTESDMLKYVSENLSSQKLSAELDHPGSDFYFIRSGLEIAGYLKLNRGSAQTEKHQENCLEIERIYVLKKFHGKGAGYLLLKKAIDVAREKQDSYIWLGVWEKNTNAIAFYNKNGFVTYDKHFFKLGNDEQTDLMMRLRLD